MSTLSDLPEYVLCPSSKYSKSVVQKEQKRQTMNNHNAFLVVVTMMTVTTATVVDALVPTSKNTHTAKNNQCPSYYINQEQKRWRYPLMNRSGPLEALMATIEHDIDLSLSLPAMSAEIEEENNSGLHKKKNYDFEALTAPIENDIDLSLSLPAMSAEIKQENNIGLQNKNNHDRKERKRRSKKNATNSLKGNGAQSNFQNKKAAGSSKNNNQFTSSEEFLHTIPKLSDILEGPAAFELGIEVENKNTNKKEIKVINAKPRRKSQVTPPTLIVKNDVAATASTGRIDIIGSNNNKNNKNENQSNAEKTKDIIGSKNKNNNNKNENHSNAEKTKQQTKLPAVVSSKKTAPATRVQSALHWRANYKSSKRTQGRLQKVFFESTSLVQGTHSHAKLILDTLLDTPAQYCNAVNLVCALTYSAKAMGNHRVDHMEKDLGYRKSLQETFDILHDLLVVHRDEGLFTPRQLCNVVWAIAKHVDRDHSLLVSQQYDSPESRLEETIDEIARQLTSILYEDDDDISETADGTMASDKPTKSSFQQPKIKLGEICMACWAYGKLRHRETPPGWPAPPQMGAVKNPDSIVSDWKTEQLGKRRRYRADFVKSENDYDNSSMEEIDETDALFDAMGYALCQDEWGDEQNDDMNDGLQTGMLKDCTWSELANVGWAFASHGRCRSDESENLLKAVALEASNRLKEGSIANNNNYHNFLARDVTQLLWSLGTLQADNFRLGDDLILLVESLTSNLRLGMKTGSRFAQGRPLRRWSCADLVQTSVALAHARIDENLLLRAIYEEGNFRLMEGASTRKQSSLSSISTEKNNIPRGEDRKTFHPWEASIMLWAQARLFLTEQEGVEFDEFAADAPLFFLKALRESRGSFPEAKIGPQEQANIIWSLVILEKYHSTEAIILIDLLFVEAARSCKANKEMQLEHAHQLWQAYYMLEEDCPEAVKRVPEWFVSFLKDKWNVEKARLKLSSARHQSLSKTLQFMGVDHINEHDEDIDVAIILQPNAIWVHETDMDDMYDLDADDFYADQVSVAVEFDGPNHFTRLRNDVPMEPPRALGHTVLKYRLLKKQGWTVVRVPYYEFDKIPFWASMERQRYLQRKLKTHANIQFSEADVSEYKTLTPNRNSRFD